MRRRLTVGCGLGVAVLVVAMVPTAEAIKLRDWNGRVKGDPDSFVSFNVAKSDSGVKRVRDVVAGGLAITCDGGIEDEADGVFLEGKFRVRHREFGGRTDATIGGLDPPATFKGRLKRGKRAVGTIRLRGELDPIEHPGVNCRTGRLEWRAKKSPPLLP